MVVMEREARNELIRELRYLDGLSCREVGERVGLSTDGVQVIAPGRPGKVDNTRVRKVFEQSGRSAADVAREIGWMYTRASGKVDADGARVKCALGINEDVDVHGRRRARRRRWIDAETAGRIAEACGVAAWAVCD